MAAEKIPGAWQPEGDSKPNPKSGINKDRCEKKSVCSRAWKNGRLEREGRVGPQSSQLRNEARVPERRPWQGGQRSRK